MFWKHRLAVLSTSEEELPSFIAALISQPSRNPEFVHGILPILPTEQVYIFHGSPDATLTQDHGFGAVISCELCPTASLADRFKARYLNLTCRTGKLGSRDLRIELHKLAPFLTSLNELGLVKLMISCDTGLDLAAGVALAVLCLCASENGTISFHDKPPSIDKDLIRRRLGSIVVSQPEANPSRTTIQAVKDFLMSAKYIQADAKIGEVKQFPAQATVTSIGNAR
ncbi:MAG: hypothetical protein M1820_000027 [Bogoriella megaspora]|nr:MAG: hypothetical protein M1820_000027 [Bogoriella megaspora]